MDIIKKIIDYNFKIEDSRTNISQFNKNKTQVTGKI